MTDEPGDAAYEARAAFFEEAHALEAACFTENPLSRMAAHLRLVKLWSNVPPSVAPFLSASTIIEAITRHSEAASAAQTAWTAMQFIHKLEQLLTTGSAFVQSGLRG